MRIELDLNACPAHARLTDARDFGTFKVVAIGAQASTALADAARLLGRPAGDEHVWVDLERLKELAGDHARDEHWLGALDDMVAFADRHGWLDEGAIRAHVEWAA